MGVPVVDESNWKRRHWPPKQLFVLSSRPGRQRSRCPSPLALRGGGR